MSASYRADHIGSFLRPAALLEARARGADPETLRALVPEPLEIESPLVKYEFIRMPNSTGRGAVAKPGR